MLVMCEKIRQANKLNCELRISLSITVTLCVLVTLAQIVHITKYSALKSTMRRCFYRLYDDGM